MMRRITTLGIIGSGVIGAGWAARALHAGIDVIASDANPAMEATLRHTIASAQPSLQALTEGIRMPPAGTLRFVSDALEVAANADLIQENVPEDLALKHTVLTALSHHSAADVIIASSTSGILPSDIQRPLAHPQRVCVAHPFNPVYLCPLVEIVGGQLTAAETLGTASDFYRRIGMHPLVLERELPGHLSDRLQEAIWREILHMVSAGEATTDALDQAIVYGPGLRFAVMGMNMIFHVAGGEGGMQRMLEHFGPALKCPWTRLEAPPLTNELIDRMVAGTKAQAKGRSIDEISQIRDECLVAIQRVLRKHDVASGATLNAFERQMQALQQSHQGGNPEQERDATPSNALK